MADTPSSQSRLTVLSGPLAGRELVIDDVVDNVLVGSDPSCRFHLDAPGISAIHARLWMDASGVTVYDTGSESGLYVNDDRVSGQAPLRNGDILWLGTPGSDDVVMIQCRLPVRGTPVAPAPEPPRPAPTPTPPADIEETMVIVPYDEAPAEAVTPVPTVEDETASLFGVAPPEEQEPVAFEAVGDAPELVEDEPPTLVAAQAGEFGFAETQAMDGAEDATVAMPSPAAPEEAPVKFSLDYEEPAPFAVPETPPPVFEDETETPTVMVTREVPDQTVAMPTPPEPEPTVMAATVRAPIPAPVVEPPPPPSARPPAPAPASTPPPPKARPRTPPPHEARPKHPEPTTTPTARAEGGSPVGRYAAMGVGGLALLGIALYAALRFMGGGPKPAPTAAPATPTTMVAAPPTTQAPPPATVAAARPVDEGVTVVKTPPPATMAAAPSPAPAKVPTPAPTPATAKGPSPTPAPTKGPTTPATTLPGPSAEALKAQQVATLLGQADAAAGAHSYDQAAGLYDEALKLDPANAKASAGKAAAVASAASFKKTFVSGKTVVSSAKAGKALSGFDTEDVSVSKAPDYSGRIEFEVSPRNVKPGDAYSVKVFLTNDGKKAFKIGSLSVTTTANGNKSGGPASSAVKEVQPQQRVPLQEAGGTWQDGTTSWNLEVAVVSDHGDTFKNTVTWR